MTYIISFKSHNHPTQNHSLHFTDKESEAHSHTANREGCVFFCPTTLRRRRSVFWRVGCDTYIHPSSCQIKVGQLRISWESNSIWKFPWDLALSQEWHFTRSKSKIWTNTEDNNTFGSQSQLWAFYSSSFLGNSLNIAISNDVSCSHWSLREERL